MKEVRDDFMLIRAYIKDELAPKDNRDFEERLEVNETELNVAMQQFFTLSENVALRSEYLKKRKEIDDRRTGLTNVLENYNEKDALDIPIDDVTILDYLSGFLVKKDNEIIEKIMQRFPSIDGYINAQRGFLEEMKNEEEDQKNRLVVESVVADLRKENFFDDLENDKTETKSAPPKTAKRVQFNARRWISAAAIFMLLAAVVWWFGQSRVDYGKVYASHHAKEEVLVNLLLDKVGKSGLASPDNPQKEMKAPIQAFRKSDYHEAEEGLKKYLEEKPNDLDAVFMLGITHLELEQFEETQNVLQPLTETENKWKDKAEFHLAMAYLKTSGKGNLSIPLLEKISQQENAYYREKAIEVLKDLQN